MFASIILGEGRTLSYLKIIGMAGVEMEKPSL